MGRRSPPSATVRRPPLRFEVGRRSSHVIVILSFLHGRQEQRNIPAPSSISIVIAIMASERSVLLSALRTTAHTPSKTSVGETLYMFFALYLTTLFSLDTWAAARNSPYRAPGNNSFYRPASTPPTPGSYQAGMHGRGNAGPGSGDNSGNVGRLPQVRDSRPPMKLYGTAACGACMT